MSDGWIVLLPRDPHYVPAAGVQRQACERVAAIAGEARVVVSDQVQFFDPGANFERVRCRSCGLVLEDAWWRDRMSDDFAGGFALAAYAMPCCSSAHTLDELVYEWNAGFSRFALEVAAANVGALSDVQRRELEEILGTPLRVVYRHL